MNARVSIILDVGGTRIDLKIYQNVKNYVNLINIFEDDLSFE